MCLKSTATLSVSGSCFCLSFFFLFGRFKWQHVWWDAAVARSALRNSHRQHLHPLHNIDRPRAYFYGRKGWLPLWDSIPSRGGLVDSALQENQPLQKFTVLPHPLRSPVLLFRRWQVAGCLSSVTQNTSICSDFDAILSHRSHCADCYWQHQKHTIHTLWKRSSAGMVSSYSSLYVSVEKLSNVTIWLQQC